MSLYILKQNQFKYYDNVTVTYGNGAEFLNYRNFTSLL